MSTRTSLSPLPDLPLPNSYWVIPASLLAGEHPSGVDEAETRDRLTALRHAGIDCFIDLTEADEVPEYSDLLRPQDEYMRFEIPDMGVPYQLSRTMDLLLACAWLSAAAGASMCIAERYRAHRARHRVLSGRGGAERSIRRQTTEPALEAKRTLGAVVQGAADPRADRLHTASP